MNPLKIDRLVRWGILLCLLFPLLLQAQPIPGSNEINIELVSEQYNCATGELTVRFKVKNENIYGVMGRYNSSFHVQSGSYINYGSAGNNNVIHQFVFPYTIGNNVTIGAYGIIDNDAPYVEYSFYSISAVLPDPPVISTSAVMPLCNGATAVLTASGSTGTYVWSNGVTGSSITVSGSGIYFARAVSSCGQSLPSNSITITTDNIPATPVVTPAGNQLLCNGESITLSSTGSNITWSNGQTGNSITTGTAGSYFSYSTNGCGNSANSNVVQVSTVSCPTPLPGSSYMVCPGANKTLDAGAGYDSYVWSNGATTRTISVGPGTYTVIVSKEGCYATSAPVTVSYYTVTTPTIWASGSLQFCAGGSITLTSSPANAYNWNTGATSASINVFSSGSYFVSTTDANGCAATSAAVYVTVNPLPNATITGGGSLCQNTGSGVVTFTGSGGVAPYTFSYRVNGGAIQTITTSSGNSVSIHVSSGLPGSYTYTLVGVKESSATQCENSAAGEATVTINPLPSASISGSATVCAGASAPVVTMTGSGGTAPYVFTYEVNGGAYQTITSTGASAQIAVPTHQTGTFVYRLISVRDASSTSCTNIQSGTATIVVNTMPITPVVSTAVTHLCNGANTIISVTNSDAGLSYQWYRNGSLLSSGPASSITVNTAGVYTVRAVTPQSCITTESNSITITTGMVPTPVIIGTGKVCPGGRTPLGIRADDRLGFDRWRWFRDPASGGVLSEDSFFSAEAGQYRIWVEREGCADSVLYTVTADDTEFPAGKIELSATAINYGSSVRLKADVQPAVLFNWDLGNGRKVSTRSTTIEEFYYTTGDSLPIVLEAITERNCKTLFTTHLKVGAMKNNVLVNQSFAGRLKDWNIFPNPFSHQLKVSVILNRAEQVRIDLFSLDGRWVKSWIKNGKKGENLFELEGIESLAPGQNFFIAGFYNGIKHADKIFKQ
jgi:hypothetical protein